MIIPYKSGASLIYIQASSNAYLIGTSPVGMNVYLKDISKAQEKRAYYNTIASCQNKAAIIPKNKIVPHVQIKQDSRSRSSFFADSSKTHAGYCHIKVLSNDTDASNQNIVQRGNDYYLKEIQIPPIDFLPPDLNITMAYAGLRCDTFPAEALEWIDRKRKFSFPLHWTVQDILQCKCTLIKKAHPSSRDPEIEWKYDFSLADQIIFTAGLSKEQYEGFLVFKVLTDNVCFHLQKKLKLKHLKAVYFKTLEEIPNEMWETNFSGCILFVISSLISCLKVRWLPHLIDCYSAKEINDICVNVECIRMFPLYVLQVTAENHGYNFAQKLIEIVMKDCKSFQHNKDVMTLFTEALIPGTLGIMRVFTRLGFYKTAFQQLVSLHEQMLLVKVPSDCICVPEFAEVFEIALKSFRQKSTRVNLAILFEKYFKTDVLCNVLDKQSTFAKDILPWKISSEIEWMEIPFEKEADLSSLADYFFSCSMKEYRKRNSTLATATLVTAIACLQRCINGYTISTNDIEDEELKEEIESQKEDILLKLKHRLKLCYIYIWHVTRLYLTLEPLVDHMDDIEKLCLELPEMASIVGSMFRYLHKKDKAEEYWEKANLKTGRRTS